MEGAGTVNGQEQTGRHFSSSPACRVSSRAWWYRSMASFFRRCCGISFHLDRLADVSVLLQLQLTIHKARAPQSDA